MAAYEIIMVGWFIARQLGLPVLPVGLWWILPIVGSGILAPSKNEWSNFVPWAGLILVNVGLIGPNLLDPIMPHVSAPNVAAACTPSYLNQHGLCVVASSSNRFLVKKPPIC